ncbi:MAG: M1 family peptidase [Bacteroidetes bacterium]|nr:MAG: M1 family peptidase [Bacteroidota bacterium]
MRALVLICLSITLTSAFSQSYLKRWKTFDVQKYSFSIAVNDSTNSINGRAEIDVLFKKKSDVFMLDLKSVDTDDKGMFVTHVTVDAVTDVVWSHKNDLLVIQTNGVRKGDRHKYTISYFGVPADGLIIGNNMHGNRAFFGDNWPNRAHHWFPCIDHSSDKALVDWTIRAPNHYDVVANGKFIDRTVTGDHTYTHWSSTVPLAPKVMVAGIADFAVQESGKAGTVPVSTWVYQQDRDNGFAQYSIGPEVLSYFIGKIGEYPYEKLANVQSKTRFGGMENAGNIFYYEESTDPLRDVEGLFAHEIAHQWFGNSVTEIDWPHVWLSEGFATYLTDLYFEDKYGKARLKERMTNERESVIAFSKKRMVPVIDDATTDYMQLLNANSYQKGAWILHMLRREVGDDIFFKGIQTYYMTYRDSNASSDDLRQVFETLSGKNLKSFFKQWLYIPGHPRLKHTFKNDSGRVIIEIQQIQKKAFKFPLDIKLVFEGGKSEVRKLNISKKKGSFKIATSHPVIRIELDPDVRVLWEPVFN